MGKLIRILLREYCDLTYVLKKNTCALRKEDYCSVYTEDKFRGTEKSNRVFQAKDWWWLGLGFWMKLGRRDFPTERVENDQGDWAGGLYWQSGNSVVINLSPVGGSEVYTEFQILNKAPRRCDPMPLRFLPSSHTPFNLHSLHSFFPQDQHPDALLKTSVLSWFSHLTP